LNVTFYGVRGSTPCPCDANFRYGGNTSSVVVEVPDTPPILLDMGTGLRVYGESLPPEAPLRAVALVTHLHWDHVQGLPFFGPVLRRGSRLDVYSPPPDCGMSLAQAFHQSMRPPYFPVHLSQLRGEIRFTEVRNGRFDVGDVTVTVATIPHVGPTAGYRLDWAGRSIVFIPDHQQPSDGSLRVDPAVVALARGADLLIHDAQYTAKEFRKKSDWGHSTIEFAVEVAEQAEVGMLALFHHDPAHTDDFVDGLAAEARAVSRRRSMKIFAAHEGLTLALEPCTGSAQGGAGEARAVVNGAPHGGPLANLPSR
jgi:phosphoribosyl 1,2-cyclic phosphodiesterase